MHEEIQQWEIHPKFSVNRIVSILIGVLTGLAFGYLVHNLVFGAVLGLVVGAVTAAALSRANREKPDIAKGKIRLWMLVPMLGFMALTALLWTYRLIYM